MSQWYLCQLWPKVEGRSYYFLAQVYAASAEDACEAIDARYPASWRMPMFSVATLLEPLREEQLGWQDMAPPELDYASI